MPQKKTPQNHQYDLMVRARQMRKAPTKAEALLWKSLRRCQLGGYRFLRQYVINPYIVDFYCSEARLIIEVDGEIHEKQQGYDEKRDELLTSMGYNVLRVTNDEGMKEIDSITTQILEILQVN